MKKLYVPLLLLGMSSNSMVFGQTLKAVKATGGNGLHNSRIFWISWDMNNNKAEGDILLNSSNTVTKGTYTSLAGYKYDITLTHLTEGIKSAKTTDYYMNSFPVGYTGFTPSDISNVLGLRNITDNKESTFKMKVEVYEPGSSTPMVPKGLIVAGSESLNGPNEYYSMKMSSGSVKLIDKYIYNNAWGNFNVNLKVSESGKKVVATQNAGSNGDGRGDIMLLAENVGEIEVGVKGSAGQHLALGIIEDIDYSDAPESYGVAFHAIESNFSDSKLTYNLTGEKSNPLNKLSNVADIVNPAGNLSIVAKPKLYLGNDVDPDNYPTTFPLMGQQPNGDDNNGVNDDDGFVGGPVAVNYDLTTHSIGIKVNNSTGSLAYLYVWVDKNKNGNFDDDLMIKKTISSSATPTIVGVDFKEFQLPPHNQYYTRLRLSTKDDLTSKGFAPDGEVEDHLINVYQKLYNIFGTIYKDNNAGTPDGIPFTGTEGIVVRLYSGATLPPAGTPALKETTLSVAGTYFFEDLYNGTYTVEVVKPAGNLDHVSSTDTTPTDGVTTVVIENGNHLNVNFGLFDPVCYKDPTLTAGAGKEVKHGITALGRAGTETQWPMARTGAWTALESKNTGFVINRVVANLESDGGQIPDIANPIKGMIVYDTTNHCLKIYDGTLWKCYNNVACPDQ